jgi:3-oxoadipate enol-lactonase
MPYAEVNGSRIHYRISGDSGAPVIVLSNSLGTDFAMWNGQVPRLESTHRVLRYDSRGHGGSAVTTGPYTIELLAQDVVALLAELRIPRVDFCGLSLGGNVGLWLAAHEPALIDRLVVANSAAVLGPREIWDRRIEAVQAGGMGAVAELVLERWFTAGFRASSPAEVESVRRMLLATSPAGYAASCAAIRDMDLRNDLQAIRAPTLVIGGSDDPATPPATCRNVADAIANSRWVELPAAHLSNMEASDQFNAALVGFLIS